MNFEKTLKYLTNNKVDKITFHRDLLTYYKDNKEYNIITTNWDFIECQILIKELNKLYNNTGYCKANQSEINKKLKQLKIK